MAKHKRSWRRRFRRGGKRHRRDKTFPLAYAPAIVVPVASILGGGNGHSGLIDAFQSGDMGHIATEVKNVLPYELIGYKWDGSWDFGIVTRNIGLILGGMVVHKLAAPLNRKVRNIPLIGKYITI